MKHAAILLACVAALGACSNEPEVDVENASVSDVAREVADASGSASFIRAGQWESKVTFEEMTMPDMPPEVAARMKGFTGRVETHQSCLTPEQVEKPKEDFFAGADKSCRYDHFKMADGKIDAVMRCSSGGATQEMAMAGTYSPEAYSMRMKTKASGGAGPTGSMTMTMKVDAKRIGDCPANDA